MILVAAFLLLHCSTLQAQWYEVQLDDSDMAMDMAEALSFTKYATYPQYVQLDTIGVSEQGRLLLAVKISDNVQLDEPEASFLYTATMHGDELVGYPLMLRLINYLLSGYETDSEVIRLVDHNEFKRRQSAPGVKITPKAFGRDRRLPITNRYR